MSRFYYFHPQPVQAPPAPTGIQYAADYLTAAGITSSSITAAAYQLQDTLLQLGLLSSESRAACRFKALYPMAGGTALAHSINFINPEAYRIAWQNAPAHTAAGVQFNGVNQYGETGFTPAGVLSRNNSHLAFYVAEPTPVDPDRSGQRVMGATNGPAKDWSLAVNRGSLTYYSAAHNDAVAIVASPTPRVGLIVGTRTSNSLSLIYDSGEEVARSTTPDNGSFDADATVTIGQSSFSYDYSRVPCSFASMGEGLSPAEASAYTAAVQQFQTALGRAR